MMSKKAHREEMECNFWNRMADSSQVEVVSNGDSWQVRCYDHHGFYIGGVSGLPIETAQNEAHRIAVSAHLSIPVF